MPTKNTKTKARRTAKAVGSGPLVRRLEEKNAKLTLALKRIEKWQGEFPETGRFWDEPQNTQPMSYGAAFGSNGERDFMRQIARDALA